MITTYGGYGIIEVSRNSAVFGLFCSVNTTEVVGVSQLKCDRLIEKTTLTRIYDFYLCIYCALRVTRTFIL